MKNKLIYLGLAGMLSLSLATTSCTGNFEETNTDPNNMTLGQLQDPWAIFQPMFYGMVKTEYTYYSWFWNDELSQYTAFCGGTTREENRYKIGESNFSSVWNAYCGTANNAEHMIELARTYKVPQAEAVAMTVKVLTMANLTDMFGDIPYKEAFKARTENITTPVFESQKDVYEDMIADLDSANNIYAKYTAKDVNTEFQAMDLMYQGDMTKWRKFNNTLKLRLLCRASGRDSEENGSYSNRMKAMLGDAVNYPIFTSNSDNATVNLTGIDPYLSYFHDMLKGSFTTSAYHPAEQLINLTTYVPDYGKNAGSITYIDPRLPIWATQHSSAGWKGAIAGALPEERSSNSCYLNYEVFVRDDAPVYLMDYAEVQFILAEMNQKGLISTGDARTYCEDGIKASMDKWATWGQYSTSPQVLNDSTTDVYLKSALGCWDSTENKLEFIGNQKYLALFWTGMEAFHEIRRTGYPDLVLGNGTDYNDYQYPQRFAYPNTSVANNRENVDAAITRMGQNCPSGVAVENSMKVPVWWSKEAITKQLLFVYKKH